MRKNSSQSQGSTGPGARNKYKKDSGDNAYGKAAKPFKKNYDGRPSDAGSRPPHKAKPYSGRITDSEGGGAKRSFDKPFAAREDRPGKNNSFRPSGGGRPEGGGAGRKPNPHASKPYSGRGASSDGPKRSFDKPFSERPPREGRPFRDKPERSSDRPFSEKRTFGGDGDARKSGGEGRPFSDKTGRPSDKPFEKRTKHSSDRDARKAGGADRPFRDKASRPFDKERSKDGEDRKPPRKEEKDKNSFSERSKRLFDRERPVKDGEDSTEKGIDKNTGDSRPFRLRTPELPAFSKDIDDEGENEKYAKPFQGKNRRPNDTKPGTFGKKKHFHDHTDKDRRRKIKDDDDDDDDDEDKEINQKEGPRLEMPLNKYIAHSGECSRRDAAELVKQGKVKVNGELVLDPGYRVLHDDKVTMSGKKLTPQKGMVYILLNKPKGFITTNDDPQGRKTVMELVASAGVDRMFPVGRLDRDTSGLLLITNDGDLTQKLCHPSYAIKKVYHVTLDRPLTKADFEKIVAGVELEDGKAIVDEIAYLEKKNELGLQIHSGRNRIVRRIFESLNYVVEKLDRVMYAGLTKKNLPRSKWRYLDEREVVLLKHFKA